jgi:CheY-like chemotaxis protein
MTPDRGNSGTCHSTGPGVAAEALSRLSHEFKTPLVTIKGYAELLLDQTVQPLRPELRDWVRRIAAAANRLAALVRRAAAEERADLPGNYHPTSMSAAGLVRRCLEEASVLAAGRDLSWSAEVPEGLGAVEVDPEAARDLLMELLQNAARATPDGGEIRVGAETEARALRPGVRFTVRDSGVGIPPEPERLFERFVTLGGLLHHHSGDFEFGASGLGLGLSLVRAIARAHGGEAWAMGKGRDPDALPGSEFHVWLPRGGEGKEAGAGAEPRLSRGRLLVVDPDPETCRILSAALAEAYDVEAASSGSAALELWSDCGPWDACIFESVLPDMGGVELVRALRTGSGSAAILCYTSASTASVAEALRAVGADACVSKPVRARVLLQRLQSVRTRRSRR